MLCASSAFNKNYIFFILLKKLKRKFSLSHHQIRIMSLACPVPKKANTAKSMLLSVDSLWNNNDNSSSYYVHNQENWVPATTVAREDSSTRTHNSTSASKSNRSYSYPSASFYSDTDRRVVFFPPPPAAAAAEDKRMSVPNPSFATTPASYCNSQSSSMLLAAPSDSSFKSSAGQSCKRIKL